MRKGATVIADRGYDAKRLRDRLGKAQAKPCIPPRRNRKIQLQYDTELYKPGNIVERMFNPCSTASKTGGSSPRAQRDARKHSRQPHTSPKPSYDSYEPTP